MSTDLAHIHDLVRPYTEKNDLRAFWEVASTLALFIPLVILLYVYRDHPAMWLGSIPGALMLVRLFSLGHEAGHAALFRSRRANQWIGRFLALFSFIPYGCWHRMHYVHHQRIGKVGGDHEGYMWIMTRQEYRVLRSIAAPSVSPVPQSGHALRDRPDIPVRGSLSLGGERDDGGGPQEHPGDEPDARGSHRV